MMGLTGIAGLLSANVRADDPSSVFAKSPDEFKKARPALHLAQPPAQKPLPVVQPIPLILEVEGASSVQAIQASGQIRQAPPASSVAFGETVRVSPHSAARMVFAGGTQILLSGNSEVVPKNASTLELKSGEIRCLVEGEGAKSGPHKFLIHTRAAVLGVRGTDFLVNASGDKTIALTVSGVVDVARDPETLQRGGTPISAGHLTEALRGSVITAPRAVALEPFLREFHQRHPRLDDLWKRAVFDAKSGRIKAIQHPTALPLAPVKTPGTPSRKAVLSPAQANPGRAKEAPSGPSGGEKKREKKKAKRRKR